MSSFPRVTFLEQTKAPPVQAGSVTSSWQPIHSLPTTQDAATVTNPAAQLNTGRSTIMSRSENIGTTILFRLRYPAGATVPFSVTNPTFAVFGRTGSGAWERLRNRAGNLSITIAADAADATDGTNDVTTVDHTLHAVDCLGCNEIIVGIETALAGTGVTGAVLESKIV
jgi:hypothetical protein